jgi:hypothetical protein
MAQYHAQFAAARQLLRRVTSLTTQNELPNSPATLQNANIIKILDRLEFCHNLRVMHTENNRLGLAHGAAELGDVLLLCPGLSNPMVLRETKRGTYNLVSGECYLYGVMNGELMDGLEKMIFEANIIILE